VITAVVEGAGGEVTRPSRGLPWGLDGPAIAYDTVGDATTIGAGLRLVAARGSIVLVGVTEPPRFEWTPLHFKEVSLVGSNTYSLERDAQLVQTLDRMGYDEAWFGEHHSCGVEPLGDPILFIAHVAQVTKGRRSTIDGRTTRHPGYGLSQRIRKRVEEIFGWLKTIGGLRKTRHRGLARVGWMFTLANTAYNLVRIPKLLAVTA